MLIRIDAIVHNVDFHLATGGEVVNQVIDRLFQLAAIATRVIGHHRATALKINRQRQVLHTAIGARVPVHGRTQVSSDLFDEFSHFLVVNLALGCEEVAILAWILSHQ